MGASGIPDFSPMLGEIGWPGPLPTPAPTPPSMRARTRRFREEGKSGTKVAAEKRARRWTRRPPLSSETLATAPRLAAEDGPGPKDTWNCCVDAPRWHRMKPFRDVSLSPGPSSVCRCSRAAFTSAASMRAVADMRTAVKLLRPLLSDMPQGGPNQAAAPGFR